MDDDKFMDELRRRTQGEGEKIAKYINNLQYIANRFSRPLKERSLVHIIHNNLLSEYSNFMMDKSIKNLESIEKYGMRYEEQQERKNRYFSPP